MKLFTFIRQFVKTMSQKINYPSADRNKTPILTVLQKYFDTNSKGDVLEISSGTGQHAAFFATHFPNLTFQPTEYDTRLLESIKAYAQDTPTKNVNDPVVIDITTDCNTWNLDKKNYDYMFNVNMMHIAPFNCAIGLFSNAAILLKPGGIMVTYGPYAKDGVITPQSNIDFNTNLRRENSEWGLRDINDLEKLAKENGISLIAIHDLPSNNKCLVWKKL